MLHFAPLCSALCVEFSMLMLSCSKTEQVTPAPPATSQVDASSIGTVPTNSIDNMPTSSMNGDLSETANVVLKPDGTTQVFNNDAALVLWANAQSPSIKKLVNDKLDEIKVLQKFAKDNGLLDNLQATEQYYIDTYGDPTGDGAPTNGFTATSNFVGMGLIFDNTGCGGNSLNIMVPFLPSFFWMNNRASSYVNVGVKILCTRTWFRGRKFWAFANFTNCLNIPAPFNDNTMSCI